MIFFVWLSNTVILLRKIPGDNRIDFFCHTTETLMAINLISQKCLVLNGGNQEAKLPFKEQLLIILFSPDSSLQSPPLLN